MVRCEIGVNIYVALGKMRGSGCAGGDVLGGAGTGVRTMIDMIA